MLEGETQYLRELVDQMKNCHNCNHAIINQIFPRPDQPAQTKFCKLTRQYVTCLFCKEWTPKQEE